MKLCRQAYVEKMMANNKARQTDEQLRMRMVKEFPDQKIWPMNFYRGMARGKGIELPRYDDQGKIIPLRKQQKRTGKGFEAFLFAMFEKYGAKPRTVMFYQKKIETKFSEHNYLITRLAAGYNSGRFGKPSHQIKIHDTDGIDRTPKQEACRAISKAKIGKNNPAKRPDVRKKISEANSNPSDETRKRKSEAVTGSNNPNYIDGSSNEPYPMGWANIAAKIRERDNYTCQMCGCPENGKAHSVHHIDSNPKNCKEQNLITFCENPCHIKTKSLKGRAKYESILMKQKGY